MPKSILDKSLIVLLLTLLMPFNSSFSQSAEEYVKQAKAILSGNSSKEWVYETWIRELGPESICREGGSFVFHNSDSLTKKKCNTGDTKETKHEYEITFQEPSNMKLRIDSTQYEMSIYPDPERPLVTVMKLIAVVASKSDLEDEYTFYYEEE